MDEDEIDIECHKEFDKWARLNGLDVRLPDNQYSFEVYRNPETLSIYRGWKTGWKARKLTNIGTAALTVKRIED